MERNSSITAERIAALSDKTPVHQLRNLKVGDVLPFRVPDNAEVSVNGFPVFKADIGSVGNQSAVKITETVMAGDDNE